MRLLRAVGSEEAGRRRCLSVRRSPYDQGRTRVLSRRKNRNGQASFWRGNRFAFPLQRAFAFGQTPSSSSRARSLTTPCDQGGDSPLAPSRPLPPWRTPVEPLVKNLRSERSLGPIPRFLAGINGCFEAGQPEPSILKLEMLPRYSLRFHVKSFFKKTDILF
jgi:hypothetical protein